MVAATLALLLLSPQKPVLTQAELLAKAKIEQIGGSIDWVKEDDAWILSVDITNRSNRLDLKILEGLPRIGALRIFRGGLEPKSLTALSKLKELGLFVFLSKGVGDKEMKSIAECKAIYKLDVMSDSLTSAGLEPLKSMPKLARLYLYNTKLKDADIGPLQALISLKVLTLPKTVSESKMLDLKLVLVDTSIDRM